MPGLKNRPQFYGAKGEGGKNLVLRDLRVYFTLEGKSLAKGRKETGPAGGFETLKELDPLRKPVILGKVGSQK